MAVWRNINYGNSHYPLVNMRSRVRARTHGSVGSRGHLPSLTRQEVAKRIIARISPVAWEHIIFTGRYHFKSHREINFEELVDYLEQAVLKTR